MIFNNSRKGIPFRYLAFFLLSIFHFGMLQAQTVPFATNSENEVMQSLTDKVEENGWLYFKQSSFLFEGDLFANYKTAMGLGADDQMVISRTTEDDLGYTFIRYQQYYKGIPVVGTSYTEHLKDCVIRTANGHIVEQLNLNGQAEITEKMGLEVAITEVGADQYAWQNEAWEAEIKEDLDDESATYYPTGQLRIVNLESDNLSNENYVLAWEYDIQSVLPYKGVTVYVNAANGTIVKTVNHGHGATGTAVTLYNGTQDIRTKKRSWPLKGFKLKDVEDDHHVHTKKWATGSGWGGSNQVIDQDNEWGTSTDKFTSPHWGAHTSWDYFEDNHNWSGPENEEGKVRVYGNYTEGCPIPTIDCPRVFYQKLNNKHYLHFGAIEQYGGGAFIHSPAIDVVAHEYTHGIVNSFAGLSGFGEAGMISEGICDVFGEVIEKEAMGENDWIQGVHFSYRRNLSNPSSETHSTDCGSSNYPASYQGAGWVYNTANECNQVHINSTVFGRWFNILAEGGSQNGVDIFGGVGMEKAAKILFRALTNSFDAGTNFQDARSGTINAARVLYGPCSDEIIITTNAWAAVNVGSTFSDPACDVSNATVTISGSYSICASGENSIPPQIYTASSNAGNPTFSWTWPIGWGAFSSGSNSQTLNIYYVPNYHVGQYKTISCEASNGASKNMTLYVANCPGFVDCGGGSFRMAEPEPENSELSVSIFPNPAANVINIELPAAKNTSISIYSNLGQLVHEEKLIDHIGILELDVQQYANGIYLLVAESEQGRSVTKFSKVN